MAGKNQRPARPINLGPDNFTFKSDTKGEESIVATTTVPKTQVWQVPSGRPLVAALVTKQTVTVTSGATESKTLGDEAPKVDFMDDFAAGEYTSDAYIAAYYDSDGDSVGDTLVTDTSSTQWTGNYTEDGDFIQSVELSETAVGGDVTVDIYTVVRHGYAAFKRRSSGKGNVSQELQTEDAITLAFSNPDKPDSNRQVTWDASNAGKNGVLPPKYKLDVVYYDKSTTTNVEDANAENLRLSLPVRQRPLRSDESGESLRRKVRNSMLG